MKMLRDLILVKLDPLPTKSDGGVELPDTIEEPRTTGIVTMIGPLVVEIKENDNVKITAYAGANWTHEGIDYIIAKESDVLVLISRGE